LRPERGSATRFTRGGSSALPSNAAFEGIRGATPWLPMAPERIRRGVPREPVDAPEQVLRRLVLLRFPGSTNAAERRQRLIASGWFNHVESFVPGRQTARPAQSGTDPLANDEPYGQPDPDLHRWQWALETIRAPGDAGAWHFTLGRAQVASLDGGLQPDHPDVAAGPLSNFRAHQSARVRWLSGLHLDPAGIGENLAVNPNWGSFLNHGIHVNTVMAAPRNRAGIAGVCPECTLQTFKVEGGQGVTAGGIDLAFVIFTTNLAARFGSTALNHSFEGAFDFTFYGAAIGAAVARDVVMVAAAGNSANGLPDWGSLLPHSHPAVIRVGASDRFNFLWRETTIVNREPISLRHPVAFLANASCPDPNDPTVCVRRRILDRCASPGPDSGQCGSNIGAAGTSSVVTIVAPGAQVIGGMVMAGPGAPVVYQAAPILPTSSLPPGLPPDQLESFRNTQAVPPSETGLGVGGNGVKVWNPAVSAHGPATGTSMAAPHVTATAGLMRSINPLLSAQAVRLGLTQRAKRTGLPEVYEVRRMGQGLLDARHAVEDAAGQVRGARLRNRLVPMFAMYAAESQIQSESAEGEFFGSTPIHSWLFTTNPQLASAAIKGDIYYSGVFGAPVIPAQVQFGPTMTAAYVHSHLLTIPGPLGVPIPETVYELPAGAGNGKLARTPAASFWVYTTPHSPLPGYTLQPLYRLSTDMTVEPPAPALPCAGEQRKHLYSTDLVEVQQRTAAAHVCNEAPMLMRYHFESIEGYVYDRAGPQPPGTVPLFRVFSTNPGFNVAALVVQGESLPGYTASGPAAVANTHFLGWVYRTFQPTQSGVGIEAADLDQDGLPNGVEIALGLNEQSADGDCDSVSDALEYGFANLPGDPMSPTANCVDGRVDVSRGNPNATSLTRVIFSNPAGPAAFPQGLAVRVTFFQGGGWPTVVPVGCVYDTSEVGLSFRHYLCSISSSLPAAPGSSVEFKFEVEARSNPSSPLHRAVVIVPNGFTDPGILSPSNNIKEF
jgi:subtilisin family serine protease